MTKVLALGTAALGLLAVPVLAILALVGLTSSAIACTTAGTGTLAPSAPVPAEARVWVAMTHAVCPDLPEPWIAAVMLTESGFHPDAYAPDRNGGTWGLFQLGAGIWSATYGAPWDADLNHNGVWDVKDPQVHAAVAGKYLCHRLAGVRTIRATHPDWASVRDLSELDDLVIAHNAGENWLADYPSIPAVTATFIRDVRSHVAQWSTPSPTASGAVAAASSQPPVNTGCMNAVAGAGTVIVPPGTPSTVADAVRTALDLVGLRAGYNNRCDRLACRAYGFANSGYLTAAAHWTTMVATGHAHPGDRCPPVGAFVFWSTRGPDGHVSLVVQADPGCDPSRIKVVSNGVLDSQTGFDGGVYLVTLAQIESGFVSRDGYLGWSDPVCAGVPLPRQP